MINRTLVRTHVVQTLFAHYEQGGNTNLQARKELIKSFDTTYDLYLMLLEFVNELTHYAQIQYEERQQRAKATHEVFRLSRRFIDNRLAQQMYYNKELRNQIANRHLSWEAGLNGVSAIYQALQQAPFYIDYIEALEDNYQADNMLWRKIMSELLPNNEDFINALDEMEIHMDAQNWTIDLDVVLSYVIKTIRRFKEDTSADEALLPIFENNEELQFAEDLLQFAIEGHDEYQELIADHLHGWDPERIPFMDKIILQVALAEIIKFPSIAIQISLNEYIEIAKEYSGEKSYLFINGVLDGIIREKKLHLTL